MNVVIAALAASVVWLIVGSFIYLSRGVKNLYRRSQGSQGVKRWIDTSKFYIFHYIILLYSSLVAAVIFNFMKSGLPQSLFWQTVIFGTFICVFQTIPRILETSLRSSYPINLLFIEFINYAMSGYAVAFTIALIL